MPVLTIEPVQDATTYFVSISDDLCELVITHEPVDGERMLVLTTLV